MDRERVRGVGAILNRTWAPVILRALDNGPLTFTELIEALHDRAEPHISERMCSKTLRALHQEALIERRPGPAARGHQYALTPLGTEFIEEVGGFVDDWLARHPMFPPSA
ncbi:winged helix-turn-helix transcriptional regulator [Fodinicola feengrottensis]|uniref:Helix-turn-helix domain-containing protein n=1 Tax=Fodinicola feengrottensis TaxID=435914 RepID=A0ABP4RLX3_9ACTN